MSHDKTYTLDDFKSQLQLITRLGPMRRVLGVIPGMERSIGSLDETNLEQDLKRLLGVIDSMTRDEKRDPKIIDQGRRHRIAVGSGVEPLRVNELVKMFEPMAEMMKSMAGKGISEQMRGHHQQSEPRRPPYEPPPDSWFSRWRF